jgi:hypothetical protein
VKHSRVIDLRLHQDAEAEIQRIRVEVARESEALSLTYQLLGDLSVLRIPGAADQVEADRLWAHSCFEVFWRRKESSSYWEYNFSPSGQWAAYAFSAYRQRQERAAFPVVPNMEWSRTAKCLLLRATLLLPRGSFPVRLALSAVLERADGHCLYYAAQHPESGAPDFHHAKSFSLFIP